jgi:hypothetical protein
MLNMGGLVQVVDKLIARMLEPYAVLEYSSGPHLSSFCSNSSFWLILRQLRLYQEREAG